MRVNSAAVKRCFFNTTPSIPIKSGAERVETEKKDKKLKSKKNVLEVFSDVKVITAVLDIIMFRISDEISDFISVSSVSN